MQVVGLNPNYDFWYYSRIKYEGKWVAINNARKAVISQYAEINKRIKEGKL